MLRCSHTEDLSEDRKYKSVLSPRKTSTAKAELIHRLAEQGSGSSERLIFPTFQQNRRRSDNDAPDTPD